MTVEYNGLRLEEKAKGKWFVYYGTYLLYALCGELPEVERKIDSYSEKKTK